MRESRENPETKASGPDPATMCARPAAPRPSVTHPLSPPIILSSVFEVADLDQVDALYAGQASGFIYARDANPNAAQLADKIARLEGAEAALVSASGDGFGVGSFPRSA